MSSLTSFVVRLILSLGLLIGCGRTGPFVWASDVPPAPAGASQLVRTGDKLQVVVHGQESMSGEFEVRPGGEVIVPVAGQFRAAGKSIGGLTQEVIARLQGVLEKPYVTIVIASRKPVSVSVLGEVRTPGRYELADGDGVIDALARAGGLTAFADDSAIFVIRRANKTPRVRFRYADLAAAAPTSLGFELVQGDVVLVE